MNLAPAILGSAAVAKLEATAAAAVVQIGTDHLTRADLSRVDCFNFVAARILSEVLHDELHVKNLRDVYDNIAPSALALPRLGVVCLAVLGAAFEARGIGGDTPLESWVRKHAAKKNGEPYITTFSTIKHHERDAAAAARRDKKKARR